MRVGIYNEPHGAAFGGSEVCVAVLADALSAKHDVEIIHHRPKMDATALARFAAVNLDPVGMRFVAPHDALKAPAQTAWARYTEERKRDAPISEAYDLFISFSHMLPPFCSARIGILVVLFPFEDPCDTRRQRAQPTKALHWTRDALRHAWLRWRLHQRLKGYQFRFANSRFTSEWTRRRWFVNSEVVYPPAGAESPVIDKTNSILAVGRFAVPGYGHSKHQLEMMETFNEITSRCPKWGFQCVGASGSSAAERAFVAEVNREAERIGASVEVNIQHMRLVSLYRESKIFWHAAGLNVDEQVSPELVEHFGMTTVEAMANGCVPVVIDKGGQREIVEHGVSGFLWQTRAEWIDHTCSLIADPRLFQRMSAAARVRARVFCRANFVSAFENIVGER